MPSQPGILAGVPRAARFLTFHARPGTDPGPALSAIATEASEDRVVGLGRSLVVALGGDVSGLRTFSPQVAAGVEVPATPASLWCWLRGDDRGQLIHRSRSLQTALENAFDLDTAVDAFQFRDGRDLTGYVDGTENPTGDDATRAAIVAGEGAGLDGSSFVAVQQWIHDLDRFQSLPESEQDAIIGRRIADNEEIDDAPASAHVKRTAQESFEPEAFLVRRSMPWSDATRHGLVFVAFGCSFDAFEAQLRRMVGAEDGLVDALFRFTRPVTGSYFWCPPVLGGSLDLRAVGL